MGRPRRGETDTWRGRRCLICHSRWPVPAAAAVPAVVWGAVRQPGDRAASLTVTSVTSVTSVTAITTVTTVTDAADARVASLTLSIEKAALLRVRSASPVDERAAEPIDAREMTCGQ